MSNSLYYNKIEYLKILKRKRFDLSHFELVKHLFIDTLLGGAIYIGLLVGHWVPYLLSQLLIPILMFRAFALMHDAVHFTISKNVTLNNIVGVVAGAFCLLPFAPWKNAHLEHHYWAGNVEKDPVMKIVKDFKTNTNAKNAFLRLAWKSWIPVLALLQHFVFWGIGFKGLLKLKSRESIVSVLSSYMVPFGIYAIFYKAQILTPINVVPGLIAYLVIVEIVNFPHHLEMPQARGDTKLKVWDQFLVSRSCHYPRWFSSWILNNFNLHVEHHMFPQAPWYMLNGLKSEIAPLLKQHYNYCLGSQWIISARKKGLDDILISDLEKVSEKKAA